MKTIPLYLYFAIFSAVSFFAHAAILEDSFESGDMSATNNGGFAWGGNNKTSVVSMNAPCNEPNNPAPVAVYNNRVICNPGSGDWTPKEGSHSLRFSYPAGTNTMAEQLFSLGVPQRDLWLGFWLRVPTNFNYPTSSPSNSKLLAIYMDGYSQGGEGPTVIWGPWSDGVGGAKIAGGWSEGGYKSTGGTDKNLPQVPFISASDQGKWMHLVFHLKAATNDTSNDGIIQMYRRWNGDTSYTQIHNITNANIPAPTGGPNGWSAGYLMGWSNPGYSQTERTDWLLDSFTASDTTLLNDQLANPEPPTVVH